MGPLATIGFTILGMSLVIGVKSIIDLYAKLIGVSSLLDDRTNQNSALPGALSSDNGPTSSALQNHTGTTTRRHSVGWYLSLAVICVIFFRVVTP